jgi:hypothetical protein
MELRGPSGPGLLVISPGDVDHEFVPVETG